MVQATTAAQDRADSAWDKAAGAQSAADAAQTAADDADDKAEAAQSTATEALSGSINNSQHITVLYSLANTALGVYTDVLDDINLNDYFVNTIKAYLTGSGVASNLPEGVTKPCFFEAGYDADYNIALQLVRDNVASVTYMRTGEIALGLEEGEEPSVSWNSWHPLAPTLESLLAYIDSVVAERMQGVLNSQGTFTGFYDTAPAGAGSEGDIKLKADGTKKAVYTSGSWIEEDYSPADWDLWGDTADSKEYYWLHNEWNPLDFSIDLAPYFKKENISTSFPSNSNLLSDEKAASEKLVKNSLTALAAVIPSIAGLEQTENKTTSISPAASASNIKYTTEKSVRTELDALKAEMPVITGLENTSNKTTSIAALESASDVKYPSEKAVRTELDSVKEEISGVSEDLSNYATVTQLAAKADASALAAKADASALANYAPLASPAFTGAPTAPTAAASDNSLKIANTAFVQAALPNLSGYAPLASPTLTGTPTVPTAAAGTNNTQAASTAFVNNAVGDVSAGFSTQVIRTSSGSWSAPKTGVYRVTCIGGGGGGGRGGRNTSYGGSGGSAGGTTSFGSYCLAYGGGGGGGGGTSGGGGGGAAGLVNIAYVNLTAGANVSCTIGAGGSGGSSNTSSTTGNAGSSTSGSQGGAAGTYFAGGSGGAGASCGDNIVYNTNSGRGGNGGFNGYQYGYGGGGGGGGANSSSTVGAFGIALNSAGNGIAGTTSDGGNGGPGGAGAIIIEY
jgi:hypothetical protein